MDVCERMNSKVMLQFMLATAWEMELMGHRAESIHLDQESWSEVGELKETFLAMVGLVRIGSMEELAGHVIEAPAIRFLIFGTLLTLIYGAIGWGLGIIRPTEISRYLTRDLS